MIALVPRDDSAGSPPPDDPDDDPRIGSILDGRFRLTGCLGTGGMGVVYRATQLSVGREVALKVMSRIPPRAASPRSDDLASERFLREARLASRLSHPAIVATYDCGETRAGELWIAMEQLRGRTLRQMLDTHGALPLPRALAIAEQVAAALDAAHAAGVIHRDVKPSNVMVLEDDRVKLLDFGLARGSAGDTSLTQSGVVCGTPAYLAPEVALGRAADARSDLYGLGLLLHEMLSGAHPFAAATPEAQVSLALNLPPPRLTAVPPAVAEVVHRLIARAPDERCPSAAIAQGWIAALRAGRRAIRTPRRPARLLAIGLVPMLAAFIVAFAVTRRAAPDVVFQGGFASAGGPRCARGVAWLRIDSDRVIGRAVSDLGQAVDIVGTQRPSGAIVGVITRDDHPLGSFEGAISDGHARGAIEDHSHGCTGQFDLVRAP